MLKLENNHKKAQSSLHDVDLNKYFFLDKIQKAQSMRLLIKKKRGVTSS